MRCVLAFIALIAAAGAQAHDARGTVVMVDFGLDRVQLDVELPVDDLRLAFGEQSQPGMAELPVALTALPAYVDEHLDVTTPDGAPFALTIEAVDVPVHDDRNWAHLRVRATPPDGSSPRDIVVNTNLIDHRVISHRVYVFVRKDVAAGVVDAEPTMLDVLHYQHTSLRITRGEASVFDAFAGVFRVGGAHIAGGADHLLFLLAMLLPVGVFYDDDRQQRRPQRRRTRDIARTVTHIVTAFTVGHSITLVVGAVGGALLPSRIVESGIALSIVVSAINVFVPIFRRHEARVALVFGFVHGLGFASALEGIGIDRASLVVSTLAFNMGIEAVQLLLVLVCAPSMALALGSRCGRHVARGLALVIGVVALGWCFERVFLVEVEALSLVDSVFAHGVVVVAGLVLSGAAVALLDWVLARPETP
jgi:hypothetical protein